MKLLTASLLLALLGFQGSKVTAHPEFQLVIPNGYQIPNPCDRSKIWAGVGHEVPEGGSAALNPFGNDFKKAGYQWTQELCMRDSDADGRTNGQELGDPYCVWRPGTVPTITDLNQLTHPGVCEPVWDYKCSWPVRCPNYVNATAAPPPVNVPVNAPIDEVICEIPPNPPFSYILPNSTQPIEECYIPGDCIFYACNNGYTMSGQYSSITCQNNGQWSPVSFSCQAPAQPSQCYPPVTGPNIVITSGQKASGLYMQGDVVMLACGPGTIVFGKTNQITCLPGGTWSTTDLVCVAITTSTPAATLPTPAPCQCSAPMTGPNIVIVSGQKSQYQQNDQVTLGCMPGYTQSGSGTQIRCMQGGVWSLPNLMCSSPMSAAATTTPPPQLCQCYPPSLGPYVMITSGEKSGLYTQYDSVNLACQPGFMQSGSTSQIQCMQGGVWSPSDLRCSAPMTAAATTLMTTTTAKPAPCQCPTPPTGPNVVVTSGLRSNGYIQNDVVTLGCMPGYTQSGSTTQIRCSTGSVWTPSDIVCSAPMTAAATTTTMRTTPTATAPVLCQCYAPFLPPYVMITSGQKSNSQYMQNDIVNVACQPGFVQSGSISQIQCMQGGIWSPSDLKCSAPMTAAATTTAPRIITLPCQCYQPATGPNLIITSGQKSGGLYEVDDVVMLACQPGYVQSGSMTQIRCLDGGTWSPSDLRCSAQMTAAATTTPQIVTLPCQCYPPPTGSNVIITSGQKSGGVYEQNDMVILGCQPGYVQSGSMTQIRCLDGGYWSPSDLMCSAPMTAAATTTIRPTTTMPVTLPCQCYPPPTNPNVIIVSGQKSGGLYEQDDQVTLSCSPGFTPKGMMTTMRCLQSGIWSPSDLTCEQLAVCQCTAPTLGPNTMISSGQKSSGVYEQNDIVSLTCMPGFQSKGTILQIKCMDGAVWSPSDLTCGSATCTAPTIPTNLVVLSGQKSNGVYAVSDMIKLGCANGYTPAGQRQFIQCMTGNSWSVSDISCNPNACATPPLPQNSIIVSGQKFPNSIYYVNDIVSLGCLTGFQPMGTIFDICCLEGGHWSQTDLTCNASCCQTPTLPANARIITGQSPDGGYNPNDMVTLGCNTGFTPSGNNYVLRCLPGGAWSGTDLTCSSGSSATIPPRPAQMATTSCTVPDMPKYSTTIYPGSNVGGLYPVGDYVQYGCQPGYAIFGTIQCRSDGSWSGYAMSCQSTQRGIVNNIQLQPSQPQPGAPCIRPPAPTNASPVTSSAIYSPGEFIEYKCNGGSSATGILTCLTDGSWSAAVFTCKSG